MVRILSIFFLFLFLMSSCQNEVEVGKKKIIVFTKTTEFRHNSISAGVDVISDISNKLGYEVVHTENSAIFNSNQLSQVEAIVFLNTTGDVLNSSQQDALVKYMVMGGNFMGIHSAANTEMDWQWYSNHLGGKYDVQIGELDEYIVSVKNDSLGINKRLPEFVFSHDKLFPFTNLSEDMYVLLEVDFCPNEKSNMNIESMPLAWIKRSENGRVFYTSLGHTAEAFETPFVKNHIASGLRYLLTGNRVYHSS